MDHHHDHLSDEERNDLLYRMTFTNDPFGLFGGLPPDFRTDPRTIMHLIGELALSSNTTVLAQQVGMSRMGLRKAMAPGANPSFVTVAKVARALGLALDVVPAPRDYDSERTGT